MLFLFRLVPWRLGLLVSGKLRHEYRLMPRGAGLVRPRACSLPGHYSADPRAPRSPALEAGSDATARPQPGAYRSALEPEGGAATTVQIPILREEPYVVSHSYAAGERHIPVCELEMSGRRLPFGEDEQARDPFPRDADHRSRAAAAAAAASHGCGCWHTGQYTAGREMIVRHRTQYLPLGGGGIGPTAPGAAGAM